jgi:hypothetical protein
MRINCINKHEYDREGMGTLEHDEYQRKKNNKSLLSLIVININSLKHEYHIERILKRI